MALKRLVASLLIALLIFSNAPAQSPTGQETAKTEEEEKARKELEEKALALLDEVVVDAATLRIPENRFKIQSHAAIMLWEHDAKRARIIFRDVMSGFIQLMNYSTSDEAQNRRLMQSRTQLRQEIMQLIATRDAEMALEFLRATRPPPSTQATGRGRQPSDDEDRLEMNLAAQVAATDPERALELAQESLQKGVSSAVIAPLTQLQSKDEKAAARLAGDIVTRLRTENLAQNQEAMNVALSLLRLAASGGSKTGGNDKLTIMSEQSFTQLLDMVTTAALNNSAANSSDSRRRNNSRNAIRTLQSLMPEIEKYAPSRAEALRKRTDEISRNNSRSGNFNEYSRYMRSNVPVETLLEVAAGAPAQMQEMLYQRAASRAASEGDLDRARQIANDNISNPNRRNQILANIENQSLVQAADREKLEEARQRISQIQPVDRRVPMMIQLALTAEKALGKETALKLLDEVRYQVVGRAANYQQLDLRIQVARAYAQIDPLRGFELIESTIDHLNELITAAEVLDGFDIRETFQDGEMRLQPTIQLTGMTQRCLEGLASLSEADFERARLTGDRFHRPEVRVLARLSIIQGVLYGQTGSIFNRRNFRTNFRRTF